MVSNKKLISSAQEVLKKYGATGEYELDDFESLTVVVFKNPGWSSQRIVEINKSLYDNLIKDFGEDFLKDVRLLIEV